MKRKRCAKFFFYNLRDLNKLMPFYTNSEKFYTKKYYNNFYRNFNCPMFLHKKIAFLCV